MAVFKHIVITWVLAVLAGCLLFYLNETVTYGNGGLGGVDTIPTILICSVVFGFPSFFISWLLLFILMKVPMEVKYKIITWIILCLGTLVFNFLLLTDFSLIGSDWDFIGFVIKPLFLGTLLILLIRIPSFIILALKFSSKPSNS